VISGLLHEIFHGYHCVERCQLLNRVNASFFAGPWHFLFG